MCDLTLERGDEEVVSIILQSASNYASVNIHSAESGHGFGVSHRGGGKASNKWHIVGDHSELENRFELNAMGLVGWLVG